MASIDPDAKILFGTAKSKRIGAGQTSTSLNRLSKNHGLTETEFRTDNRGI